MNLSPSFPYEVTFPDFPPSDSILADVEKYLSKIDRLYDRIVSCHVAVRAPHRHQRNHIYHIHIQLRIPGDDIVINREAEKNFAHIDIHVALRDAFEALHTQLRERVKRMKKHNKKRGLKMRPKVQKAIREVRGDRENIFSSDIFSNDGDF